MKQADSLPDALKQEAMSDPKAAQLLKNPAALKNLLSAPETQQLMSLLSQQAGGDLQSVAQAAAKGKPQALMGLLDQVMHSKEGSAAVEGLQKKAPK